MPPRKKRGLPVVGKNGRRVVPTEENVELLFLVGLMRYMTPVQIHRAGFFASVDRTRRRLRDLLDAGYLTVTYLASTEPNLIGLSRAGLILAAERFPEEAERLRLAGPLRPAAVHHHLGVVDARLFVAAVTALLDLDFLLWSNAGGALQRELGLAHYRLDPDGLARLGTREDEPSQIFTLAAEFDTGSEGASFLEEKLRRYSAACRAELLSELWFVYVGGRGRGETLASLIEGSGLSGRSLLLPHEAVLGRTHLPSALLSTVQSAVQTTADLRRLTPLQRRAFARDPAPDLRLLQQQAGLGAGGGR